MNFVTLSIVFVFFAALYLLNTKGDESDNTMSRDQFAAWHCYQKMTCTPGGGWVCGVDRTQGIMATFPDKCHLHGVNCRKQGVYKQISTHKCKPKVSFIRLLGKDYGQAHFEYSTLPYGFKDAAFDEIPRENLGIPEINITRSERFMERLVRKRTKMGVGSSLKVKDGFGVAANVSIAF
ncbi:hypothetical protein PYW08_008627 [Mythimna loreyi]|uniref:Uncharacterized protein n=1 Tax=Mythimna loreyi TaxID=667449 RepID=A0ACC2Q9K4_9NEOP|nr:hypothetical protein PYW08_008627 [Mythimna loreyi]